ncbi:MAG: hypothetical protein AAFS10_01765, partial [Myxococcota bacterium]
FAPWVYAARLVIAAAGADRDRWTHERYGLESCLRPRLSDDELAWLFAAAGHEATEARWPEEARWAWEHAERQATRLGLDDQALRARRALEALEPSHGPSPT